MSTPLEDIRNRNFSRAMPMSALFELTFVCNHACSFCYNSPTGQKEMNTREVIDALRKLADLNILYLTLSGGEPLLRKDFFEIATAARQLGFALRIYTNGYLIDEPMAKRIKSIANPIEIEISIHGGTAATHEKLTCVPGSFRKVVEAVRFLRAEGIKVNLKCPVTRNNQGEVLAMESLAAELGASILFDTVITPRDDGDREPVEQMSTDDFLERFWKDDAYRSARREDVPQPRLDRGKEAICGTGRSSLAIDPYGNIYPCVQLRRKAGNIRELESLRDMWKSSPVLIEVRRAAVEMTEKLKVETNGSQCGFCMGVADLQMGDLMTMYPQVARNAEFRARAYEAWKKEHEGEDPGGVSTRCEM